MSLDQNRPDPPRHAVVPQLSLPVRLNNQPSIDPSSRFTDPPLQTTTSPRVASYYQTSGPEYRSPVELTDVDRSPRYRTRRNNSDDATMSIHSGYDNVEDTDFPMEETSGIRRLRIDDPHGRTDFQAVGQKRRASSPPGGDSPPQGPMNSNDPTRRRDGVGRGSPAPRLSLVAPGSLSSASPAGRSASYVSTTSLNTSISSLTSFGGRSPSGLSSGGLSPVDMMANSLTTRPSPSVPLHVPPLVVAPISETSAAKTGNLRRLVKLSRYRKPPSQNCKGVSSCVNAAPKKPKKFETPEELRYVRSIITLSMTYT